MEKIYFMFLAEGFEETEAIATLDVLRRAGIEAATVGVGSKVVTGAHGVPVTADVMDCEITPDEICAGVILPGGMPGTLNLEKSECVNKFIDHANKEGKLIGAICAAPSILGHKGLLVGKKATCFDGFEEQLIGADLQRTATVTDGNIITACGAGAALEFGFELVKYISGAKKAEHLRKTMLCDR